MDALEFFREYKRMHNYYEGCGECPLERGRCSISASMSDDELKNKIAAVKQWSWEHPRKTRQSVFLEQYPDTILDMFGVIQLCPMYISTAYRTSDEECKYPENMCIDCRRKFWMQEVE